MEIYLQLLILCLSSAKISALSVLVCEQRLDTIYCPTGIIQIDNVLYGRTQANLCNTAGSVFQSLNLVLREWCEDKTCVQGHIQGFVNYTHIERRLGVPRGARGHDGEKNPCYWGSEFLSRKLVPLVVDENINLNCRSTQVSTNAVKTNCQGRTTCLLQAANSALNEDPCPGQGKYLQVQYRCVASIINNPVTTTKQPITPKRTTVGVATTQSAALPPGIVPIGVGGTPRPGIASTGGVPVPGPLPGYNSSRSVQLCHENLVSGSRGVPDSQLSASSQLALASNVHRARLYIGIDKKSPTFSLEGCWTADPSDTQPWIQVKMNWLTIVQGIVTQGRHVNPDTNCCLEWVTRYKVHYSIDGSSWETVTDKTGNIKIFVGNTDSDTVITQMFDCPVTARFIKIEVVNYSGAASMRLDVIGCPTNTDDIGVCPKGWKERPNTGKCYFISDQRDTKTWEEGQLMCKRRQGDIVKIDDIQEKIWLRNELLQLQVTQNLQNWWIGLNNRPRLDNSYYKWDDGTPFKSTAVQWNPGEPNNSGGVEHCAHYSLISDALNDRSCDIRLPFICEMDKYWTQPINVPVAATAKPTPPTTKRPATVIPNKVPVPIGGGGNVVSTGANVFSTGCLKPADCTGKAWDDYPSCDGCHYFLTCAPNGNFRRVCPLNLKFDANLKLCSGRSSTCTGP